MSTLFLKLVNMSLTASLLVPVILLLRLLLKKAPKWLHCALWALVALRLLLPVSLPSPVSLVPSSEPLPQTIVQEGVLQVQTGIDAVDRQVNAYLDDHYAPVATAAQTAGSRTVKILSAVWLCGVGGMLLYTAVSAGLLRRRVRVSLPLERGVALCDGIETPFILGIVRPCIYLPSALTAAQRQSVLAHERAHLRRHDHWWKPLGFLLLAVYWFDPVLWLAYVLLCRDIELACDERVIRDLDTAAIADYSQTLLDCSRPARAVTACPLAFGEVGVRQRIKAALNYKKPAFWIILIAVIASVAVAVCFLTDRSKQEAMETSRTYVAHVQHGDFSDRIELQLDAGKQQATFSISQLSSYIVEGTYEEENGVLTVRDGANENVYMFRSTDGGTRYRFDAAASAEIPQYRYSEDQMPESALPDGTVFLRADAAFSIQAEALDTAIRLALMTEHSGRYAGEYPTEGHLIVCTSSSGAQTEVCIQYEIASFRFENDAFVDVGGCTSIAKLTFDMNGGFPTFNKIEYPEDGANYTKTAKALFPKKYHDRIHLTDAERDALWQQCVVEARAYVAGIGRTEPVCSWGDVAHPLFTDLGMPMEVSNRFDCSPYPDWIGNYEAVVNGARMRYETNYDAQRRQLICRQYDEAGNTLAGVVYDLITGQPVAAATEFPTAPTEPTTAAPPPVPADEQVTKPPQTTMAAASAAPTTAATAATAAALPTEGVRLARRPENSVDPAAEIVPSDADAAALRALVTAQQEQAQLHHGDYAVRIRIDGRDYYYDRATGKLTTDYMFGLSRPENRAAQLNAADQAALNAILDRYGM